MLERSVSWLLSAFIGLTACASHAQTISFTTTRVPTTALFGTLEIRGSTEVHGLNDSGQFVGSFGERNWVIWGMPHGFIHGPNGAGTTPLDPIGSYGRWGPDNLRIGAIEGDRYVDPAYHYLDLKPAANSDFNDRATLPLAINNAGVVVGGLASDEYGRDPSVAFVYDSRTATFSTLAVPGALSSVATGINASGQIVGNFSDATGQHGFLYRDGQYTVIDMPGEAGSTRLGGISDDGSIVGSSYDYANPNSFVYRQGVFTSFTADGAYTVASDINDAGQIVGWVGVSGQRRGFLYQDGVSVVLDLSTGTESTYAYTINNQGVIGGAVDGAGFLATVSSVPEPASAALAFAGLAGLAGLACARRLRRHERKPAPAGGPST
jgi:probable HAF family extracellular repeat protein